MNTSLNDGDQLGQSSDDISRCSASMSQDLNTDSVSLQHLIACPAASACLTESAARRLQVVPLAIEKDQAHECLVVACADPADRTLARRVTRHLAPGLRFRALPAESGDIEKALEKCYQRDMDAVLKLVKCSSGSMTKKFLEGNPQVLIQFFEWVLLCGSRQDASDIHLSPDRNCLNIRFRIDGVLRSFAQTNIEMLNGLLVRIKILAAMDIAETRRPQDGQFSQLIDARSIDFRVSCFPTTDGQNTVLRLLDPLRKLDSLERLNLPPRLYETLAHLVRRPDGLLVVCGPTGSGKSTTLHALLNERDASSLNIMTLEDPVEQILPGIRQSSIDETYAMDFASGVRGLLRQDPDVLLIGEIRDTPSCAMALRAVMSGHQVLTTVHATSALAGLSRLRELGALPSLLANNLLAIASQRLLRRRCRACTVDDMDNSNCLDVSKNAVQTPLCEAQADESACHLCQGTGYSGRQVIMEILLMTPQLASLLTRDATQQQLLDCAIEFSEFISLRDHGLCLVAQGITSEAELIRVLGENPEYT